MRMAFLRQTTKEEEGRQRGGGRPRTVHSRTPRPLSMETTKQQQSRHSAARPAGAQARPCTARLCAATSNRDDQQSTHDASSVKSIISSSPRPRRHRVAAHIYDMLWRFFYCMYYTYMYLSMQTRLYLSLICWTKHVRTRLVLVHI